jgi:hypothetical protein
VFERHRKQDSEQDPVQDHLKDHAEDTLRVISGPTKNDREDDQVDDLNGNGEKAPGRQAGSAADGKIIDFQRNKLNDYAFCENGFSQCAR